MASNSLTDHPRRRVLLAMYWWEDRILEGVARYAADHNWELECRMRWTHTTLGLEDWSGDGIIANAGFTQPLQQLIRKIRQAGVPMVSTQQLGEGGGTRVIVRHHDVGRVAAEHLLSLGFTDLAYVFLENNEIERSRRNAFQSAVTGAGCSHHDIQFRHLARTLRSLPRPVALMAMNDINALSVMRVCLDAGYRIPEDSIRTTFPVSRLEAYHSDGSSWIARERNSTAPVSPWMPM
jgi:LacI family transcriptional regulator